MSTPSERFWSKVDASGDCWLWTAGLSVDGYGKFYAGVFDGHRRYMGAHRWAYETMVGPIPDGLQLDHLCREKRCVNPDHLEPVTNRVNMRRNPRARFHQNARKTHCPKGHAYSTANTLVKDGSRNCRACHADRERDRRARNPHVHNL